MRASPKPRVESTCPVCGAVFMAKQSALLKGSMCCSKECGSKRRSINMKDEAPEGWAGSKPYTGGGDQLLCIPKVCEVCNKDFMTTKQNHRMGWGKCCSRSCATKLRFRLRPRKGKDSLNWKGDDYPHKKRRAYLAKYRMDFPQAVRAQQMLNKAVKNGLLVRKPCEECGNVKVHAHHPDYSEGKELEVNWLCPKHHRLRHIAEKKQYEQRNTNQP